MRHLAVLIVPLCAAACTAKVEGGCLPEGCELTLTCDDPRCNVDSDGDGVADGLDCAAEDPTVHQRAEERCGDGRDDDCDGSAICDGGTTDADGDDYGSQESGGTDCDDGERTVHPGAVEQCGNGRDDDCDGSAICDGGTTDADGDDYGSLASGGTDCDDDDPTIHPGARERCNGAIDDDCDGSAICDGGTTDADGDGFAARTAGGTDCADDDADAFPGAAEDCDTAAPESCGTEACTTSFVRLPLDNAALSAQAQIDGDTWLAGTPDGRLYRSVDGGLSWLHVASLTAGRVTRLVVVDATTIAAAVQRVDTEPTGVWLSTDGGETWSPGGGFAGLNGGEVTDLCLGDGTPFGLWATTTGGGVNRSTDGGATFTRAGEEVVDAFAYAVLTDPEDRTRVVVVTDTGVYRSFDGGDSFTATLVPLPVLTDLRAARLALLSPTLYLLLDDGGVWASDDFGATFAPFTAAGTVRRPRDLARRGETWAVASQDRGLLLGGQPAATIAGAEAFAVTERGTTDWQVVSRRGLFVVEPTGVRHRRAGLDGLGARALAWDADGELVVAGVDGVVWWSDDAAVSFLPSYSAATALTAAWWRDGAVLAVAGDGRVWRVAAPGATGELVASVGDPVSAAAYDGGARLAVAFGAATTRVFEVNLATNTSAEVGDAGASRIDALTYVDGVLLAGNQAGEVRRRASGAASFTAATTSPGGGSVTGLAAVGGAVYATVSGAAGGLHRSTDGGDVFVAAGAGSADLRGLCVEPVGGRLVLLGATSIQLTADGEDWSTLPGPPPGLYGNPMARAVGCAVREAAGVSTLWVPTLERGVWSLRLP